MVDISGAGSLLSEEVLVRHAAAELCCDDGRQVPDLPGPPEESLAEAVAPELRRARGVLRDHLAGAISRAEARAGLWALLRSGPLHPAESAPDWGYEALADEAPRRGELT
ncbi:hypothetical protein E1265_01000 [Streptomyces sp. 8K308]|uniref:hypothetical protein n=1 Tax=Streptomyces sp. 8K308 TaxID=2530388 RepID=UPI00104699EE|nr:hypothetical protein [Streptomyces sp. 8K308]TDC27716.1 hypothetical protein E1265_01000 [Streptomyces sp. 8K308]